MAGGAWPSFRVHEIHPEVPATCSRCGHSCDDALHCFWKCPANANIDYEAVALTQVLIPAAERLSVEFPAFGSEGLFLLNLQKLTQNMTPSPHGILSIQTII